MRKDGNFSWFARLAAFLLLLSLMASACGGKPTVTPTPTRTPKPTFTPTPANVVVNPVQPTAAMPAGQPTAPAPQTTKPPSSKPTATPMPPTPTPLPKPYVLVKTNDLNVRSGPSTRYPVIGKVNTGQKLNIVGKNAQGTWWKVCCVNGRQGWLIGKKEFVEVGGDLTKVAIAAAPPPPPTRRPTRRPTNTPRPQPTKSPYMFPIAKLQRCDPNAGITYVQGTVYVNHKQANGYIVVFSWSPDGPYDFLGLPADLNDLGCVSYKSGCADNTPGKWSHILQQGGARAGDWYFWIIDKNTRQRISEIAHVHTDGTAGPGKCQQAVVDFDTR